MNAGDILKQKKIDREIKMDLGGNKEEKRDRGGGGGRNDKGDPQAKEIHTLKLKLEKKAKAYALSLKETRRSAHDYAIEKYKSS